MDQQDKIGTPAETEATALLDDTKELWRAKEVDTEDGDHHEDALPKQPAATLLLNKDGTRKVTLHAPSTITKAELDRIQKWLSFQLIVEDEADE
jgi:hypothetical protein